MFQIWPGFERAVVPGIVVGGKSCGVVRVLENFQILTPHIFGMAEVKSIGIRLENGLPNFVVSLRNGRSEQAAES